MEYGRTAELCKRSSCKIYSSSKKVLCSFQTAQRSLKFLTVLIYCRAGMATARVQVSKDMFTCPICLELFNQPVSLPCGHSFCKECIQTYWTETINCRCPCCKGVFIWRPDLQPHVIINQIVNEFKASDSDPSEEEATLCCMCSRTKAFKSCLTCLASYCQVCLESRQDNLKIHTLVTPLKNLEERLCKTHKAVKDWYCRTDKEFICTLCFRTDHKSHDVTLVVKEFKLVAAKTRDAVTDLQKIAKELTQKKAEFEESVKKVENEKDECMAKLAFLSETIEKLKSANEAMFLKVWRKSEECSSSLDKEICELKMKELLLTALPNAVDRFDAVQAFHTPDATLVNDLSGVPIFRSSVFSAQTRVLAELEEKCEELMEMNQLMERNELMELLSHGQDISSGHREEERGDQGPSGI